MTEFPVEADLTVTGRRVIEALMESGVDGASPSDLSVKLNMNPQRLGHVLKRQLEPKGHVFNKGRNWVATDAILQMRFDPKPYIDRLKAELEQALFDGWEELPERVRVLFNEFAASRNLPSPLTFEEAFRFAQRRALRAGVE